MYRFNGGIIGTKVTNVKTTSGYITSVGGARGKHNGGYIGTERLSDNLDNNVNKTSGIWHLSTGLRFVTNHPVDTTVDNSYYQDQPSEQRFQQTGSTYLGGGYQWNIAYVRANCPGKSVQWPQGDYGGHSAAGYTGGLSRTWTTIGDQNNCESWVFDVYGISGYYYTYYPPPVYVEQIDIVTNYYDVWDYF